MKEYTAVNLNDEVVLNNMPTKDNDNQNTNNATHTLWSTRLSRRGTFIIHTEVVRIATVLVVYTGSVVGNVVYTMDRNGSKYWIKSSICRVRLSLNK